MFLGNIFRTEMCRNSQTLKKIEGSDGYAVKSKLTGRKNHMNFVGEISVMY